MTRAITEVIMVHADIDWGLQNVYSNAYEGTGVNICTCILWCLFHLATVKHEVAQCLPAYASGVNLCKRALHTRINMCLNVVHALPHIHVYI